MEVYKKYPSIENSYQHKFIQRWVDNNPSLKDERFIIYEKLHGANISFVFMNGEFNICSRNRVIPTTENFNQCWYVAKKYQEFIDVWLERSFINEEKYTFFGEIVGDGVQKGVNYGQEKEIYFFDMMIDDELISQKDFLFNMRKDKLANVCPITMSDIEFEEALQYKNEFDSLILNEKDNVCEGIVIKPFNKIYKHDESYFMLKSKNDTFSEKSSAKKNPKQIGKEVSTELFLLRAEFERYINENRVNNMFSKEGVIESNKQIGHYIKLILQDAKEDFIKDNDITSFNEKEWKFIFNCSKLIVDILKKHL